MSIREWLFGPPAEAVGPPHPLGNWSVSVQGRHVLDVSDVDDILEAAQRHLGVDARLTRARGAERDCPIDTGIPLDRQASDGDLSRVALVVEQTQGEGGVTLRCFFGSSYDPQFVATLASPGLDLPEPSPSGPSPQEFATRVASILNNSRRRIRSSAQLSLLVWTARSALVAFWVALAITVWPDIWAVVLGAMATYAFARIVIVEQIIKTPWAYRMRSSSALVQVDPTPRDQLRIQRANRRANWRVGVVTALASSAATLLAAFIAWGPDYF
ncbi:hypothetical protein [Cellulomonas olei]|uniref:hypothetical protein n=1 Tax=Cellulomonas sp. P4 TaxID=3142533 RepID=UPI0031B9BD9C